MNIKIYKCICGQEFDNPAKFNGHKQGCKIHLTQKYGSYEAYLEIKNRNHDRGQKVKIRNQIIREKDRDLWISEQHLCENCGKIMTEKYGSGRFCSQSCANKNRIHDSITKEKIANSVHKSLMARNQKEINKFIYFLNPNYCQICNQQLDYDNRTHSTCNDPKCVNKLISKKATERIRIQGLHQNVIDKRYKYGTYKEFQCDSSWELAFIIYHLDHDINIQRCKESFEYEFNNEIHLYFPDFIINNIYYEIKGYHTEMVEAKCNQFPKEKQLIVLYKKEIQPYLKYAKDTYGKDFTKLYDRNYPSWMDNSK